MPEKRTIPITVNVTVPDDLTPQGVINQLMIMQDMINEDMTIGIEITSSLDIDEITKQLNT